MIPGTFKYTVEGSTPSFADNEGQVIEAQTQVRLRIKGIRSELGQMYAIGSIREDYLGYGLVVRSSGNHAHTDLIAVLSCSNIAMLVLHPFGRLVTISGLRLQRGVGGTGIALVRMSFMHVTIPTKSKKVQDTSSRDTPVARSMYEAEWPELSRQ